MARLSQLTLFIVIVSAVFSCQEPAKKLAQPTPPGAHQEQESSPDALTGSAPTTPKVKALVGFDQVAKILGKKEYGPCSSCHSHEWPYLSRDGSWSRFLESLKAKGRQTLTYEDLVAVLVDCVDPLAESHCAGAPEDPSDNWDFKMPSKYGFDTISADDLAVLKQWQTDGARESSVALPD